MICGAEDVTPQSGADRYLIRELIPEEYHYPEVLLDDVNEILAEYEEFQWVFQELVVCFLHILFRFWGRRLLAYNSTTPV